MNLKMLEGVWNFLRKMWAALCWLFTGAWIRNRGQVEEQQGLAGNDGDNVSDGTDRTETEADIEGVRRRANFRDDRAE